MVYGGAVAAGAFAGSDITIFGTRSNHRLGLRDRLDCRDRRLHARLGGRVGHRLRRGQALSRAARTLAPCHAREARPGGYVVRPLRRCDGLLHADAPGRPLVRVHSRRHRRDAAPPLTPSHVPRDAPLVLRPGSRRRGTRQRVGGVPRQLPLRGLRDRALLVAGVAALVYRTYRRRTRKRAVEEKSAEWTVAESPGVHAARRPESHQTAPPWESPTSTSRRSTRPSSRS